MRRFIFFLFLPLMCLAQTTFQTQVKDIDHGDQLSDEILVLLSNGRVAKLSPIDPVRLKFLQDSKDRGDLIAITVDKGRVIQNMKFLKEISTKTPGDFYQFSFGVYVPSVVPGINMARSLFMDARKNEKESQCYNRAHIWSYEWRLRHRIYSSKVWVYFTRKYIRKFNFEWWFHVAPFMLVNEEGQVHEHVMDIKYARGPIPVQRWTDIFLRNDAVCPVVEKYSDQANYPEANWCYLMKSSMYHYQPIDLENFERFGTERFVWSGPELRGAYLEAFDITI
jgi:Glutaminase